MARLLDPTLIFTIYPHLFHTQAEQEPELVDDTLFLATRTLGYCPRIVLAPPAAALEPILNLAMVREEGRRGGKGVSEQTGKDGKGTGLQVHVGEGGS